MFPHLNKKIKLFSVLAAIFLSWAFLIFSIYDASHPTEGITGALIQALKSKPDLEKKFSNLAHPPMPAIATNSASPTASTSATTN